MGFPPGTPANAHAVSWHGLLHFVSGGIGFLGLIAACFVFTRRFAAQRLRGWAVYSLATGVFFFAAFVGIAVGSNSVAVVIGWAWVSVMAAELLTKRPRA